MSPRLEGYRPVGLATNLIMDRLPPPYDNLVISRHAQSRMHSRHISLDEVQRALTSGHQLGPRWNTIHYDPITWVGVVVDWRSHTVITVMNVWLSLLVSDQSESQRR